MAYITHLRDIILLLSFPLQQSDFGTLHVRKAWTTLLWKHQSLNTHFPVGGLFLFLGFDPSNRTLPGLLIAVATLPHAVTTLQCAVYFTTRKYLGCFFPLPITP